MQFSSYIDFVEITEFPLILVLQNDSVFLLPFFVND